MWTAAARGIATWEWDGCCRVEFISYPHSTRYTFQLLTVRLAVIKLCNTMRHVPDKETLYRLMASRFYHIIIFATTTKRKKKKKWINANFGDKVLNTKNVYTESTPSYIKRAKHVEGFFFSRKKKFLNSWVQIDSSSGYWRPRTDCIVQLN